MPIFRSNVFDSRLFYCNADARLACSALQHTVSLPKLGEDLTVGIIEFHGVAAGRFEA